MATVESFNNMLKKYMPYELLTEEMVRRDYFLSKVDMDNDWAGGEVQVPFRGAKATSRKFGGLTNENQISEYKHVLGTISNQKELWGSMIFNDKDLGKHGSLEKSFIKILPDQIEEFINGMKESVSLNLLQGENVANYTAAGTDDLVNGVLTVNRPEFFEIGQYVEIGTVAGGVSKAGYISQIVFEDSTIKLATLPNLVTPVDLTAVTAIVDGDGIFEAGAITASNCFTSLKSQLLSLANGGSANLFGVSKLAYPHLQAINHFGGSISAVNFLDQVFDFWNLTKRIGKGNPTEILMSYKHMAAVMRQLEIGNASGTGGRTYAAKDMKASVYGWTEVTIVGVKGELKLVAINEMPDDVCYIMDWGSLKLFTDGMFERRTSPDGKQFYEIRSETGYKYIVDIRFFGELAVHKPSHCGIIYGIPNY